MKKVFYGSHTITKDDILSVTNVLKNKKLTQGDQVLRFEDKLKLRFKSNYCTSVTNGSSALFSILKLLNLSSRDTVITTSNSFIATANCIELAGAKTQFLDINENTYNLDLNLIESFIKKKKFLQ